MKSNETPKTTKTIEYPFIPEGRTFKYVTLENEFMRQAFRTARENSLDKTMPTGSVVVRDGIVIGAGANGTSYHETHPCERVLRNIPTGQGYELCEGCHPRNHAEPRAIKAAHDAGHQTEGADLYLWGHWWCCEACWKSIQEGGIHDIYLLEGSEVLFNKNASGNIVGHQFEHTNVEK